MTVYLNKQQSCCRDSEGRSMELALCESPCTYSWQQEPHGYLHLQQHHPQQLQHHQHLLHHGSSQALQLAGATLPRQRGRLTATRSESMWRSPSRTLARTKGGSCDLWPDCDCQQGWHDPYQGSEMESSALGSVLSRRVTMRKSSAITGGPQRVWPRRSVMRCRCARIARDPCPERTSITAGAIKANESQYTGAAEVEREVQLKREQQFEVEQEVVLKHELDEEQDPKMERK
ncbi:hypothetical protein AAFF_G00416870 [Aldrovandia affinis]|uniref:Uncharacterized protein n=1 Tax=Aldrovandia affinis TaxID=143900 RepID=A0AAD7SAM0_9TELE|nr:hypothetical protein AAFF_G00416870 [Aldrovandia affinis]